MNEKEASVFNQGTAIRVAKCVLHFTSVRSNTIRKKGNHTIACISANLCTESSIMTSWAETRIQPATTHLLLSVAIKGLY